MENYSSGLSTYVLIAHGEPRSLPSIFLCGGVAVSYSVSEIRRSGVEKIYELGVAPSISCEGDP